MSSPSIERAVQDDEYLQRVASRGVGAYGGNERLRGRFAATASPGPSERNIDVRAIGRFTSIRAEQTAGATVFTQAAVAHPGIDAVLIVLQLEGHAVIEHCNRRIHLAPGRVCLLDSAHPIRCDFASRHSQLSFYLERSFLQRSGADLSARLALQLPGCTGDLIANLVQASFARAASHDCASGDALAKAMLALIQAYSGDPAQAHPLHPPVEAGRIDEIREYIRSQLQDDCLSSASIAAAHGISARTLQRLFRAAGVTLSRSIRQMRLARCAAELADPRKRHQPITEIAFRWGFNEAAHFSNVFRAEFGQAPRDFRATACARSTATPFLCRGG